MQSVYVPVPTLAFDDLATWCVATAGGEGSGDAAADFERWISRTSGGALLLIDDVDHLPRETASRLAAAVAASDGKLVVVAGACPGDSADEVARRLRVEQRIELTEPGAGLVHLGEVQSQLLRGEPRAPMARVVPRRQPRVAPAPTPAAPMPTPPPAAEVQPEQTDVVRHPVPAPLPDQDVSEAAAATPPSVGETESEEDAIVRPPAAASLPEPDLVPEPTAPNPSAVAEAQPEQEVVARPIAPQADPMMDPSAPGPVVEPEPERTAIARPTASAPPPEPDPRPGPPPNVVRGSREDQPQVPALPWLRIVKPLAAAMGVAFLLGVAYQLGRQSVQLLPPPEPVPPPVSAAPLSQPQALVGPPEFSGERVRPPIQAAPAPIAVVATPQAPVSSEREPPTPVIAEVESISRIERVIPAPEQAVLAAVVASALTAEPPLDATPEEGAGDPTAPLAPTSVLEVPTVEAEAPVYETANLVSLPDPDVASADAFVSDSLDPEIAPIVPTLVRREMPAPAPVPTGDGWIEVEVIGERRALVWIDGASAGTTPIERISLAPGSHRVTLRMEDGARLKRTVEVRPGRGILLRLQLD
jgi:hypothetical protein